MGTHPIFESDFDRLTESKCRGVIISPVPDQAPVLGLIQWDKTSQYIPGQLWPIHRVPLDHLVDQWYSNRLIQRQWVAKVIQVQVDPGRVDQAHKWDILSTHKIIKWLKIQTKWDNRVKWVRSEHLKISMTLFTNLKKWYRS